MNDDLWVMFLVGAMGIPVFVESGRKATRIAGAVWIAVWWLPPMAMLWIEGVLG